MITDPCSDRPGASRPQADCAAAFLASLASSALRRAPFSHRLLSDAVPNDLRRSICALAIAAPAIGETKGKRETHNSSRIFFSPVEQARWAACRELAHSFQEPTVTAAIARRFDLALVGSFLRIEYCLDRDGFWLERHTDIGAKLFTLIVYLSDQPEGVDWGTDLYDRSGHHAGRAPAPPGAGLAFVPASDTWHGFERRPIIGLRRSLIINYVVPDWRARHELAFPDRPVR